MRRRHLSFWKEIERKGFKLVEERWKEYKVKILFLNSFLYRDSHIYIQKILVPKLRTFLTQLQQISLITGLPNSLYKITTSIISFFHTPPQVGEWMFSIFGLDTLA